MFTESTPGKMFELVNKSCNLSLIKFIDYSPIKPPSLLMFHNLEAYALLKNITVIHHNDTDTVYHDNLLSVTLNCNCKLFSDTVAQI